MTKEELFQLMKGTVIVSCQATPGEPLYDPERSVMPLMARAARRGCRASTLLNFFPADIIPHEGFSPVCSDSSIFFS